MKKQRLLLWIHIIIPLIMMYGLAYLSFADVLNDAQSKNLLIVSLLLYFPLLFLIQGSVCALLKGNAFLSLGISMLAFISIMLIWLNSTAIIYIFAYVAIGLLGYGLTRLINQKRDRLKV